MAESIDRLHTADLPAADADRVERALDAYQIARRIVDDTSSSRIDLAGAMVLIRQAGREIAEARARWPEEARSHGRPSGEPVHGQPAPR
ncbi:hypothetical protein IOD13_02910 [Brevibacterium casei]|nr:hypothetical protein [Brevibacterium casei]